MAQQLRALGALPEESGFDSKHLPWSMTIYKSSSMAMVLKFPNALIF